MPRITRVYTRTGDDGTTGLGTGERVAKDSPRICAYGTVDELNSCLGVARAVGVDGEIDGALGPIQNDLFHLGSDLCIPDVEGAPRVPRIEEHHVSRLEELMDGWMGEIPPLENFIIPGGCLSASHLHLARCVCRRAEREVVTLARDEDVGNWAGRYLNRLSDLLFVMARLENQRRGVAELYWDSHR